VVERFAVARPTSASVIEREEPPEGGRARLDDESGLARCSWCGSGHSYDRAFNALHAFARRCR
jgi:hypothetical protein